MYLSYFIASFVRWGFNATGINQYGMKFIYYVYS